jgi:hypothetical protein
MKLSFLFRINLIRGAILSTLLLSHNQAGNFV